MTQDRIDEQVRVGQTPGAPNVAVAPQPGTTATISVDLRQQYVSGGVGGSSQWYANLAHALRWAIDDVTADFGDDLFDRMLLDPQCASAVGILKSSILEDGVNLAPPIEDEDDPDYPLAVAICARAERMFDDLETPLDDVLLDLLSAIALGNKVAEQVYDYRTDPDGRTYLALVGLHVKPRHALAFVVDAYLNVLGFLARIPGQGAPVLQSILVDPASVPNLLPRDKFAVLTWRPRDNDPRGTSVLRPAYNAWNAKRQVSVEYLRYLAQFASPGLVGITGEHAQADPNAPPDPETQLPMSPEQLMRASLLGFRNGSVIAVPFGSLVNPIQSQGEGAAFTAAFDFYDRQITKSILGQTLASEEGKHQARAAAMVHQDILDTLVRQGKKTVARLLRRQILMPWVRYNYGEAAVALAPHVSLGSAEQPDIVGLWTAAAALYTSGYVTPSQKPDLDAQLNLTPSLPEEVALLGKQLDNASQPPQPASATGGGGAAGGQDAGAA